MEYTQNLNLKKPGLTDNVNVNDLNENMDVLDDTITDLKDDYEQFKSSKGQPGGLVELDENGRLPVSFESAESASLKDKLQLEILDENFYVQYLTNLSTSMLLDLDGKYAYIFSFNLANRYYVYKYDLRTNMQISRSSDYYIAMSSGVVQNETHLFVPVGRGSSINRNELAKINKETMVTEKIVSIGNDFGSVVYYNGLIYVSYYGGFVKAFSPVDLSVVKSGNPFDTTSGSSDTKIDITPDGRMFGFMILYDVKKIREIDLETFTSIAAIATSFEIQWVSCKDNKYVYFVQREGPTTSYTYHLGRLNISNGAIKQENINRFQRFKANSTISLIFADEKYLYLLIDNRLHKINKDTGVKLFDNDFTGMKDLTKGSDGRLYFMQTNTIFRTLY
ncbi:hypothetical protein [Lysinibacillus sp. IITD104]|uniref:hypothetical protein n=1 Tax=Lysinibacillus sp. IITD104 TaxID=3116650 RepID=UPI002FD49BC4